MNELIDKIDAYLDGTMNAEERAAFETQMNSDAALREQVNVQQNLRAGIDRLGMKAATASTFRKMTLKNKIYKWGIATVAVAAVATTTYFAMNASSSVNEDGANITYELPATNETGGTEWADADRNLPTQLFEINPDKDTVIETMGGMVFAIPAGAFLNATEPVTLEIREAVTPFDIIKAGLSTTSNGELLETGGMFYLNARSGETSLKINPDKPVYANVPTNEIRPNMQVFDGERTPEGGINWVNPKPMEKQLIPVDIFSLNFYPDGFLGKVAELGFDANNRKVTDSIYYSYSGRQNLPAVGGAPAFPSELDYGVVYPNILDGEALFNANCSSCHTNTDVVGTGAGLKGVLSRIPGDGWIYDFVHNPSRFDYNMTSFPFLTNEQIDAIMAYADHGGKPYGLEIDPARIAAIQTEEFQNTILATKEFEERLQLIFSSGEPTILELYVNNLDRKLYEIDSMVMNLGDYRLSDEFRKFYDRHDGGVAISQPHMKELQDYYAKKQEAVRMASQKTLESRTAQERKDDSLYYDKVQKKQVSESDQYGQNLKKEYEVNLTEAYRQLGIQPVKTPPASAYYGVEVQSPGWKNVDAYVNEATVNRTTLDYTDPSSGKKAVIKYEKLDINVVDVANYSQLMVYLVTDSLPCFMRVYPQNGKYSEKLNELMEYSLVVMGEKDGTWFSTTTPKVTPGSVNATLQFIDEASLRIQMNSLFSGKVGSDLNAEISYMKETHAFTVRKEKEAQQAEIDRQIMEVIFPFVAPVSDLSCEEAFERYVEAALAANAAYALEYDQAVESKKQAYAEADKTEKSFKNPLEKAAKKAAADQMRAIADEAFKTAIDWASKIEDDAIAPFKKQLDASCGPGYMERTVH